MLDPKDEIEKFREELKKLKQLNANTIDARVDAAITKAAALADRYSPFHLVGKLFARLPLWAELLLIVALILGAWLGWNAFVDWAASRKYNAETTQLQTELNTAKDVAAQSQAEYEALKIEYDALKAEAERLKIDVAAKGEQVMQQQKRTATATIAYNNALKTPVAAVTIDASTDKALENSLNNLTAAAREAMRKASQ